MADGAFYYLLIIIFSYLHLFGGLFDNKSLGFYWNIFDSIQGTL